VKSRLQLASNHVSDHIGKQPESANLHHTMYLQLDWNCRTGHRQSMKKWGWTLQEWTLTQDTAGVDNDWTLQE